MIMTISHTPISRQRGLATLLVAIVMLVVLAIITLHSNKTVVSEQRSTTNEYKQALAFEAAQSGISRFLSELNTTNSAINFSKYFSQSGTNFTLKSSYTNTLNPNGYLNTTATAFTHNFIGGWQVAQSDTLPNPKDESGNTLAGVVQIYRVFLASTGTSNTFRLIAQGCADSCGFAEAFVATEFMVTSSAICPLDINGNLNVIANSSVHGLLDGDSRFTCGISVGSITGTHTDVIGCTTGSCNPGNAGNLTPPYEVTGSIGKDAHFQKYFSPMTQAQKLADVTAKNGMSPRQACLVSGNATESDVLACISAGLKNIYVTGNLNVSTNAITWPNWLKFPDGASLIVGGDFNLTGSSMSWDGQLYVSGNSTLAGSLHVKGNAAFAGNVDSNISLNVTADPLRTKVPGGGGVRSNPTLGSWRDF
ncbi:pilus assembly PilX family protein [Chitinolyticbacter albus]|uniref:pilus assembly PilX family protein n=1 Tax=Chitinolyticbacter albus TaxID=2961951 RepID=UPI0021091FDF|nr:PilX N-terminal domain-containing pilus assembly protein [Chitinolyticbacter albus]